MNLLSRYRGSLLGLAVCDALGAPVEFSRPGSFEPVTDFRSGGVFGLKAGYWTDDTSMALCLAESLVECGGFDPADQMKRYLLWWDTGYLSSTGFGFDIGGTTLSSVSEFKATGKPYCGPKDERSAGNGSLMRLAPIPLFYASRPRECVEYAGLSSMTTHGAEECLSACRYYAGLIAGALNGLPKDVLLSADYEPYPGVWDEWPLAPKIAEIAAGSFKTRMPPEIAGTGYVVKCLEAAMWAFYRSSSFREGALLAVNLGDDADSTGAVYGQLAGAYYGAEDIPEPWKEKLAEKDLIAWFADELYNGKV